MELCGARFKHPFREPEVSIVALCENVGGNHLTGVGEDFARSGCGENMVALRDERDEGDAAEPRVIQKFRIFLHGCKVVAHVLGEGERVRDFVVFGCRLGHIHLNLRLEIGSFNDQEL